MRDNMTNIKKPRSTRLPICIESEAQPGNITFQVGWTLKKGKTDILNQGKLKTPTIIVTVQYPTNNNAYIFISVVDFHLICLLTI